MSGAEKPLLVGDEVSSACTAMQQELQQVYDLYTRRKYEEARELLELVQYRAKCASNALRVESLILRCNFRLAEIFRRSSPVRVEE